MISKMFFASEGPESNRAVMHARIVVRVRAACDIVHPKTGVPRILSGISRDASERKLRQVES